jgi:hypothetical protein
MAQRSRYSIAYDLKRYRQNTFVSQGPGLRLKDLTVPL